MEIPLAIVIAIVSIVITTGINYFGFILSIRKEIHDTRVELKDDISKAGNRVTALETKIDPFWRVIQDKLPAFLHSPHTPELDKLLERYQAGQADKLELMKLKELLTCELSDLAKSQSTKFLAAILVIAGVTAKIEEK